MVRIRAPNSYLIILLFSPTLSLSLTSPTALLGLSSAPHTLSVIVFFVIATNSRIYDPHSLQHFILWTCASPLSPYTALLLWVFRLIYQAVHKVTIIIISLSSALNLFETGDTLKRLQWPCWYKIQDVIQRIRRLYSIVRIHNLSILLWDRTIIPVRPWRHLQLSCYVHLKFKLEHREAGAVSINSLRLAGAFFLPFLPFTRCSRAWSASPCCLCSSRICSNSFSSLSGLVGDLFCRA